MYLRLHMHVDRNTCYRRCLWLDGQMMGEGKLTSRLVVDKIYSETGQINESRLPGFIMNGTIY